MPDAAYIPSPYQDTEWQHASTVNSNSLAEIWMTGVCSEALYYEKRVMQLRCISTPEHNGIRAGVLAYYMAYIRSIQI
jgi:hypothetical protein